MSTSALIPARKGSKRIPGKNFKNFCGQPLIYWSIKVALECPIINQVIVSTDCPHIASYSESIGAFVPELRPPHLCTDSATSADMAIYHFKHITNDDFLLLQPTSPIRSAIDIQNFYMFAVNHQTAQLVSCVDIQHYLSLYCKIYTIPIPTSIVNPAYIPNGSLYYTTKNALYANSSFLSKDFCPYPMDKMHSIDIDTNDDWDLAVSCFKSLFH